MRMLCVGFLLCVLSSHIAFAGSDAMWSGRSRFAAVVFNDKMLVMGGASEPYFPRTTMDPPKTPMNDVWASSDGKQWACLTQAASWKPRFGHTAVVFDGRIWLMGGVTVTEIENAGRRYITHIEYLNDVWSSEDGVSWREEINAAPWRPRADLGAFVYKDRMWVGGGYQEGDRMYDLWSTSDGKTWRREQFGGTNYMFPFKDKLLMIDPRAVSLTGSRMDVWATDNMTSWTLVTNELRWYRDKFALTDEDGKMWVTGGDTGEKENALFNDVIFSENGKDWKVINSSCPWPVRASHRSLFFKNRLWIMGGYDEYMGDYGVYLNDVWSSPDGIEWQEEVSLPSSDANHAQQKTCR